jgi:Tol biopolymer transport system component
MYAAVPRIDAPPGYLLFIREQTLMAQRFDPDKRQLIGQPISLKQPVDNAYEFRLPSVSVSHTGILVYSTGEYMEQNQLVWLDRAGKEVAKVGEPGPYTGVELSPDQKLAILEREDPRFLSDDLWVMELSTGTLSRLTSNPLTEFQPLWSPRGDRVLYSRDVTSGDFF